jgi:carbamate kinase
MMRTAVVAVGGNSLIRAGEKGTVAEQLHNARRTAAAIVELIRGGLRLVVTHGNGPQVGAQLLRSERGSSQVPGQTLDLCGAATQGEIGYLLAQALRDQLSLAGLNLPVATVITQTVVSRHDPAMRHPSKPIGPFYSRREAEERQRTLGWHMVEDAARGYRRVAPSPEPLEIVELPIVQALVREGMLVVACGGGGIPVVRNGARLEGVEAVIDKDRASALLAERLKADLLILSTDADCVYLDYRQPTQRPLALATAAEMESYCRAGHFPSGSMGPKIEAALRFLRGGGQEVIITSYEHLAEAVAGRAGTHIVSGREPMPVRLPAPHAAALA